MVRSRYGSTNEVRNEDEWKIHPDLALYLAVVGLLAVTGVLRKRSA